MNTMNIRNTNYKKKPLLIKNMNQITSYRMEKIIFIDKPKNVDLTILEKSSIVKSKQ